MGEEFLSGYKSNTSFLHTTTKNLQLVKYIYKKSLFIIFNLISSDKDMI